MKKYFSFDKNISVQGRGFYIAAAGGAAYQNLSHIRAALQDQGFNVSLEDRSQDMGMLSLQGPYSREILSKLTQTPLDNESFPFNTNQMMTVAGHKVRALRVSFVGELGWELHIPRASCVPVYQALHQVRYSQTRLSWGGVILCHKLKTPKARY